MTMDPQAPEPLITWTDHDGDERYEVVPPDAFDDFSEVDSTTVDPGPEVADPDETEEGEG